MPPHSMAGPTFEEMLHPENVEPQMRQRALKMRDAGLPDPINLFNITWRDGHNQIYYEVLPKELTGVEAPIVVLYGKEFPSGSHKVGPAYSGLIELLIDSKVDPKIHTLVWPSTGNYGFAGAWISCQMGFKSIVVMRVGVSQEHSRPIESYGATILKTPGNLSNTREVHNKIRELYKDSPVHIINQSDTMGNYRFHYYVTGNTIVELADVLKTQGVGNGRVAAFCSGIGSAGTLAAGDRLKQVWPDHKIVGLEPIQCSTLYNNGYGWHDIQGIGDKHVAWIHHVMNMDAIMCLDDVQCKKGLQMLVEEPGTLFLMEMGVPEAKAHRLSTIVGISGVCNILGAIKACKFYRFGKNDLVVTVCTDAIDRYYSVMAEMTATYGKMDKVEASIRLKNIFHSQNVDWIHEGTPEMRRQWHNLKYCYWVEQQGKTVKELDAQLDPTWWLHEQATIRAIDRQIKSVRTKMQLTPADCLQPIVAG